MATKASKSASTASLKQAAYIKGFGEYLIGADPVLASIPERDQSELIGILYSAHVGRFTHNSGNKGSFPIHWEAKQEKFGTASYFNKLNAALDWFTKVRGAAIGKRAEEWTLTARAKKLLSGYLDQGKQQHLPFFDMEDADRAFVDSEKRPCRKPQSPISSKASNGTNTKFKAWDLALNVYIDGDNLHAFLHAATARLHGDTCPRGFDWAWKSWDAIEAERGSEALEVRLSETIGQAGDFLRTAWVSKLKGFVVHQSYEETTSGRLLAQGLLNLQTCHREVRAACLPGHYDYDVECCHFALLASLAKRQGFQTPRIDAYVSDKKKLRREVQMASRGSLQQAKDVLTSLLYCATLSDSPQGSVALNVGREGASRLCKLEPLVDLYNEMKGARAAVLDAFAQEASRYGRITNAAGRRIPTKDARRSQLLSHILTGEESEVLKVIIANQSADIVLLAHDGFVTTQPIDKAALEAKILRATGHRLSLDCKPFPAAV